MAAGAFDPGGLSVGHDHGPGALGREPPRHRLADAAGGSVTTTQVPSSFT
jgi:hypothetical protein